MKGKHYIISDFCDKLLCFYLSLLSPHGHAVAKSGMTSADLEVQLVQLNHYDGEYSNYWNTLLRNLKLLPYINFYV